MTPTNVRAYAPDQPLPERTTVLEASAGTGKTYTIAGLAARYLAEGKVRMDELMLVTFGRAATAELRERVRERLTTVTNHLADPTAACESSDEVVRHLSCGVPDDEVRRRHRRLAAAVADFDAATIATTHGFCSQMLAGLGIAADLDADVIFAEATGDLVTDVATDLYVADYGRDDSGLPPEKMPFGTAASIATSAAGDPAARLEPRDAEPASDPHIRYEFADRARDEVARRKRAMRVMDYNDLLTYLREALTDPETGEEACQRIRARYQIVLVDEFQDTDPLQWDILERAFHNHRTLILVGDPKQAIYAFRGADVDTYLSAKREATAETTLGTNWRSDQPLVQGLRHLLGDAALGDPDIRLYDVDTAHREASLLGAPVAAPVRLRRVPRSEFGESTSAKLTVGHVRPFVAADVAADIVRLLSSGAELIGRVDGVRRPLEAADVAVLVQRNDTGAAVRDALAAVDVPVVLTATSSVFASDAAHEWLALLTSLEQPQRTGLARNAALTSFVGWTAAELAKADEATQELLGARLRRWAETLTDAGVAALMEAATATGLAERVLARDDGERDLTDLRHIGQALHQARTEGYAGVSSLVQWLQHRMAEAEGDLDEERSRRLDSDAKAVQVMTIWRAKGLEFPVVYAPFLWDRWVGGNPELLKLHDDGGRALDVGGQTGPRYVERKDAHYAEEAGESLRLAYVALTRARSQVIAHWAPSSTAAGGALHRLLFGKRSDGGGVPDSAGVPDESAVRERFDELAATSGGLVSSEEVGPASTSPLASPRPPTVGLGVRAFDRKLDTAWSRTSYTGITAGLHEASSAAAAASEPEAPGITDEPAERPEIEAAGGEALEALVSPMSGLPSGAAFGTCVHGVLERIDFAAPDVESALGEAAAAEDSERFAGAPPADLAQALLPSLHTPLGPLAGSRRLVDIAKRDRLDELDFELPLVGGDRPTGEARVREIAALVRRHLAPGDPLAGYAEDLDVPLLAGRSLRGFLAGSIDAVLRVPGDGGAARYLVVDYKTNWLGTGEELTAHDYRPEAVAHTMRHSHYPLQALLYCAALHRYLRWRQPGYDPELHFGGVLYLFLRGMCGPETPVADGVPYGVFSWSPPPALITELSDLLHRGAS